MKCIVTVDNIEPESQAERLQTFSDFSLKPSLGYQQKAVLDDFESKFVYNTLNQLVSEEHPDDGKTEYKYDLSGNLRFKRDAGYAANGKMIYHKYDKFNRLVETGECSDAYFTQEDAETGIAEQDSLTPLVKYGFDNPAAGIEGQSSLKGRMSYKSFKNRDTWDYTYYSYNRKGDVEWISHNIQGLAKKIEYEYDLGGNIVKINYNPGNTDELYYWYEYGPVGSLISVYSNAEDVRSTAKREIKYNAADQLGNQTQLILGEGIQTVDYSYDIHSQLLAINDTSDLKPGTENDQFAMTVNYDGYYNGLINQITVHYPELAGIETFRHRYTFAYDKANRLKGADYAYYAQPEGENAYSWLDSDKYDVTNLDYDANGNILSLKRYNDSGTIRNYISYEYGSKTNKLSEIVDLGTSDVFSYSASGNMYSSTKENIESIQYNHNNLPIAIQLSGTNHQYFYGYGDGADRLYKQEDDQITEYYIRGVDGQVMAEYDQNQGIALWRLGSFGYKADDGDKYYYLKDHIGNIRVTVDEQQNIVTKDDYYPFGLQMPGLTYNNGNPNDRLKYSSKELDQEGGLYKYHFGWRDYNPELGRWHVVDPARQFASPYVYGGNNPLIGVDEDGQFFWAGIALLWKAYQIYSYASMAYDLYQGYQQGGLSGMVQTGIGIGVPMIVGAGVGGAVGRSGIFGNTLGGTILSGATSGAIGGGITSSMFGGSFGDGALSGGLAGGLSAGAGWVGNHATLAMEADDLGLTGKSAGPATDKNLNKKSQKWFGRNEDTDEAINTLRVARKDNLLDPNSYIGEDGELYDKGTGKVGGYTFGPESLHGSSDVRISASSFTSQRRLYMRLGHEFVHVDDFYSGAYKKWYNYSNKNKIVKDYSVANSVADVRAYHWNYMEAKRLGWSTWETWAHEKYLKYLNGGR